MTTAEIEAAANKGNLATSEFDIGLELRKNVIPRFLNDVFANCGIVWWMRDTMSLSITAGTKGPYTLPADFQYCDMLIGENIGSSPSSPNLFELRYIGDREEVIIAAEYNTERTTPNGFYVKIDTADGVRKFYLSAIPDHNFTARGVYRRRIPFSDTTTPVNLDKYIPEELQYLLVLLLRSDIFLDRFGEGDDRYMEPLKRYERQLSAYAQSLQTHAGNAIRRVYAR